MSTCASSSSHEQERGCPAGRVSRQNCSPLCLGMFAPRAPRMRVVKTEERLHNAMQHHDLGTKHVWDGLWIRGLVKLPLTPKLPLGWRLVLVAFSNARR